jgi:hypothetical protein
MHTWHPISSYDHVGTRVRVNDGISLDSMTRDSAYEFLDYKPDHNYTTRRKIQNENIGT